MSRVSNENSMLFFHSFSLTIIDKFEYLTHSPTHLTKINKNLKKSQNEIKRNKQPRMNQ